MCIGVTPNGHAGSTRASMRFATSSPITMLAKVSVPVGRCGPCCSTLPAGRITNGLVLSCAAISGWVSSMKWRLGNMGLSRLGAGPRFVQDIADTHILATIVDRAQRGIDNCDRNIAVVRGQFVWLAGAAALGEHF